ncbi:MAG: hypothetical protein KKE17_12265 [Proteobacteria bacterium]|nr:hypothetical protein [Pseudomonadota bacterium]MBU1710772.1 hypothetical protein [Pseudomonadota bacterium]
MNNDSISQLNTTQKKELLGQLLASLLDNLSDTEKKKLLKNIISSSGENIQVIDMVEH